MKNRDRAISLTVVVAIIAGIWWGGTKLRGNASTEEDAGEGGIADAAREGESASVIVSDASVVAEIDSGNAPIPVVLSGACRAIAAATTKTLDDAKSTRSCAPAFDTATLACKTSSNGATWGLRVDDVVDLGASDGGNCPTGWLVRLVHIDVNGIETAFVPGLSETLRAHTYDVSSELRIDDVTFFDWDGDGEDEIYLRGARGTNDTPLATRTAIWTFHAGDGGARATQYPSTDKLAIVTIRDVDSDGRPDLLINVFGDNARLSAPTSRRFLAHSLADGTFSLRDKAAITWAESLCPKDPHLDLSTLTSGDFDAAWADGVVCAMLWGHDAKELKPPIAKACKNAGGEPCPAWPQLLVDTKLPLSLR